ncbi:hydroxymethylpyrimidine/phosphomethylpyrimidine kinase [Oceaniferula spumae]|uniref:hydroxymethylpyrimidine kinase n=1 Tax=Oceaniferula spumae TaxID=2979115 RepID=A0AAT9FKA7_9BACT
MTSDPSPHANSKAVALSIAGSDCSAGAGIQADLKTFHRLGVHGLTAVTSVVSETPLEVRQIETVAVSLLQSQVKILLETYPIGAIKTGMLPTRPIIIAVCELLKQVGVPIITDPVMVASSGPSLIQDDASIALASRLLPMTTLVTPNMPEASLLLGRKILAAEELETAAREISEKFQTSCLLKGGHLPGTDDKLDVLWHEGRAHHFSHPDAGIGEGVHGTGCALSSAITAEIALGRPIETAVANGIELIQQLITESDVWNHHGKSVRCLGW